MGNMANALGNGNIAFGSSATAGVNADNNTLRYKNGELDRKNKEVNEIIANITKKKLAGGTEEQLAALRKALDGKIAERDALIEERNALLDGIANTTDNVAIGSGAKAVNKQTLAFGKNAQAKAENAIAQGTESVVSGNNGIAIGNKAQSGLGFDKKQSFENSIAIGNKTIAGNKSSVAIGDTAMTGNTAYESIAIGKLAQTLNNSEYSVSIGSNAISRHKENITIGHNAVTDSQAAIAIGSSSKSTGIGAIALGISSEASTHYATAIGRNARAKENYSLAIGDHTYVEAEHSGALGDSNYIYNQNSFAVGSKNNIRKDNTFVLGNKVSPTQANSVVLGNESTDRAATTENEADVNGFKYSGFAGLGSVDKGVVSIGKVGGERQLINVAAGKIASDSTDAINGSQLWATQDKLGSLANAVKTNFGGNAAINPDTGDITFTDIGGTGKDNIHDAIKAARTEVVAGDNVTVAEAVGQDGHPVYVVNAEKTTVSGDDLIKVTAGDKTATGVTDYAITLSDKTKQDIKDGVDAKDAVENATFGLADGNDKTVTNKLNKTIKVVGDDNITTDASSGDELGIKLNKDLKLDSVTTGDTVINDNGLTIENGPSITKTGIDAGSKKITNVAAGENDNDAVNVKQLNDLKQDVADSGWKLNTDGVNNGDISPEKASFVKHNSTVNFVSKDKSIKITHEKTGNDVNVDLSLGNDVNIGGPGDDGQPGKDGKLAVNGKDGKTGVTLNGQDGSIGMKGQDGANATLTVAKGADGVDGKNGDNGKDRLKVNGEDVATLNDGVKYEGDQGKAAVKLNQTTKVVGGAKGELTDGNIGVVASQDGKNAKLTVKLAKDLKGLNSVEAKDVTVKKGGNLKVENGANVDMGGNQVKNIASGISGKSYRNPKDNNAANIGDVKAIANQAVAPLNKRINDVDKHASAGTASAMAAAGLPQAYLPGHSMVAVGARAHTAAKMPSRSVFLGSLTAVTL